jgi:hypothetical protein
MPKRSIAEGWFWRMAASVFWAGACGIVCAALHREPWNRPTHWITIAWVFGALPVAVAGTTLLERSYWKTALQVAGISLAFVGGFWYEDHRRTGRIFDDAAVFLVFGGGYLLAAMVVTWLLRPLPEAPPTDDGRGFNQFSLRTLLVATTFSAVVVTAVMHPVVWLSVGTVYLCWLLLLAAFWASHRLKHERLTAGETIVLCLPLYLAGGLAVYRYSVGG